MSVVDIAQLRKRGRFRPGPAARHASDQNAKQDPIAVLVVCERHRGGLPPDRMLLKEVLGDASRTSELGRVGKLLVLPEDDKRDHCVLLVISSNSRQTSGFCRIHSIF